MKQLLMKRNIRANYVFLGLSSFDISSAIWVLYLIYRGLPLWQVGLLEGIFHISGFLFEVPSGALADLLGRKNAMRIGRICGFLSAIMELFAQNFWMFAAGFVLGALSYNMNSGSQEAFVYDTLAEAGEEEAYILVNSRMQIIIEAASSAATLIGGIVAQRSYVLSYGFAALLALLSLVPTMFMKEPEIHREKEAQPISLTRHFRDTIKVMRRLPEVFKMLVYFAMIETFYATAYMYGQEYFSRISYNRAQIGVIMFLMGICGICGSAASERILSMLGVKIRKVVALILGSCILLLGLSNRILPILLFCLMGFFMACLYPIQSLMVNEKIPSEQRATILSVGSMCYSFGMIVIFPICGAAASIWGLHRTMGIIGVVFLVMICMNEFRNLKRMR